MKKSVIILIGIIYAASITLVTFFGLQYNDHVTEEISVSEVKIINDGVKIDAAGKKYITLWPNDTGERKFQVEYTVSPDNAYNKNVVFYMEETDYATVDENGLVTFTAPGKTVWLYVVSEYDTGKYDTIEITFLK